MGSLEINLSKELFYKWIIFSYYIFMYCNLKLKITIETNVNIQIIRIGYNILRLRFCVKKYEYKCLLKSETLVFY
jgi:hypothetical protein